MKRMLRVLHTADWHLGLVSWKASGGVDRMAEQRECLNMLTKVARQEAVDLIIHAGDLFHHYHQPTREAIALAVKTLLELKDLAPVVWVMGNHDWYAVEALQGIFPDNVHVVRHGEPVHLFDRLITVYPLPYMTLARFLGVSPGREIQALARDKLIGLFTAWSREMKNDSWNILAAHLTMQDLAGYAEVNATREVFLRPEDIPAGFHYGAFGHLHAHIPYQQLSFPLYYSSSLVREGFGNESTQAGFCCVELKEDHQPVVSPFFFDTSALITDRLLDDEDLAALSDRIDQQARGERNFVRIRFDPAGVSPDTVYQLKRLKGDGWKVVVVEPETIRDVSDPEETERETVTMDTIPDLFQRFCQENRLDEKVSDLFIQYYREALEEETIRATS